MTDGESNRLHEMNGKIGGLESSVRHLTETWARQDSDATEARRRLHAKFDSVISSVASLSFRVDGLTTELAAIKPTVTIVHDERQQNIGSKKAFFLVWSAIVVIISSSTAVVVELVHQFWGKH